MNFTSSITLAFKDAFSSGFSDAKNSLAGMRGALDEIGGNQSMNRLAADMTMMTSMTEPARRALSNMMDQPSRLAGTMDASMRNIQSLTGQTNESLAELEKQLLDVGGASVAGSNAVADAFYNITSGIGDATVRMDTLRAAVALSESGQADLGAATSGLISVVNAYGTSADNITGLSDVFFQTVRKGVGSLDGFVSAMSSVAGLSASVGVGFDELGSAMAFVTAKGQTESVAAHQLKAAMISFMKPTSEMAEAFESMGVSSGSAMIREYGLADSLFMLKEALGGNQDAMAKALGSTEALQAAIALTADDYVAFAKSYGEGLDGATAAGLEAQALSYEARVARLQSASDALKISIGGDINSIKGFFVDVNYGFLKNFVSPIMSSPVGGAISKIAAVTGMGAKAILDFGSGAMNTAAQMTTLAANISNAGGIAKMFQSGIGLAGSGLKILATPLRVAGGGILSLGKSIIGALPAMGSYIASMWASVAPTLAATWPILAIIAGVAALAAGVYLLVKNWDAVSGFFVGLWEKIKGAFSAAWDWIKNLIFGTSDWILGAVAIFMPIVGIPALIIKHWAAIKEFFSGLWEGVKGIAGKAWEGIKGIASGAWDGIKSVWEGVANFFSGLWEKIKSIFQGFIDWIGSKIEAFTAPFKAIGDVVGGMVNKIGGFFKGVIGGGKESGTALNDAFASGIQSNASAPGTAFGMSLQTVSRQMPHSDAQEGPLSALTDSGRALTETFASGMDGSAIEQKATTVFSQILPESSQSALTDTFTGGIGDIAQGNAFNEPLASSINEMDLREKAPLAFTATAMPKRDAIEIHSGGESSPKSAGSQSIHIQNLYLQAEDCESLLDFVRMVMHSVNRPEEVTL